MDNKRRYKGKSLNKTYDLGILLCKSGKNIWNLIPAELCEIIYHYYIVLRHKMVNSYISELSDSDLYNELRIRNRDCFTAFELGLTETYNKCMDEIGILDTVSGSSALIYNSDEINSANEIVNLTIRNNTNIPEMILRTDYYTINDMYDAINAHCAIHEIEVQDVSGLVHLAINKWNSMNVSEKMAFCISNFHKIKEDFLEIEHIVTNAYRFNTLRKCCEDNLHTYMGLT